MGTRKSFPHTSKLQQLQDGRPWRSETATAENCLESNAPPPGEDSLSGNEAGPPSKTMYSHSILWYSCPLW